MEEQEKGYISRQFTVWCGLCHEWFQESCNTQAQAIKYFKRRGWRLTKANGWICEKHSQKGSEKPQEATGLPLCTKCGKTPSMIGQDLCYVCAPYR